MIRMSAAIAALLAGAAPAMAQEAPAAAVGECRAAAQGIAVAAGDGVRVHVHTIGAGHPVLMIPSLGRSVADFDELAGRLAARGFLAILPEPRGINGSRGPAPADLFALADDAAAAIRALCQGPVDVVGHALGNRIARALASAHPDLVRRVVLLAGGGGVPIPDAISRALTGSASQGLKPDAERIADLQTAFFARGNDPTRWLSGWFPDVARQQVAAVQNTARQSWWTAGTSMTMLMQASEDPIAPPQNAALLQRELGGRLTLIRLQHASHAILPEQGAAVAAAVAMYLGDARPDAPGIQAAVDAATTPGSYAGTE